MPASPAVTSSVAPTPASEAGDWLQLDRQLCFALYASSLAMTKLYKPRLEALGLTYPQYLVMLVLWERDGASVSEIGQRLSLDSGTLTPLLKRMQQSGWLDRRRSREDERRVEIHLTEAGRTLRQQAAALPPSIVRASGCRAEELAPLVTQLHSLRQRLIEVATEGLASTGAIADPIFNATGPAPTAQTGANPGAGSATLTALEPD
ncbi:MAG: hypothetical protein RL722_706 [Pseudomonadota bacterium]|jgi:DNA-binding MarR family transcriptional regulator